MRILLAVPGDEEVGGVAYVVGNLARYFRARGHDVIFVFPGSAILTRQKVTKFGFPGFEIRMQRPLGERHPIISILAFLVFFPIGMYQVARLIQKYRIEIINIHYPADCFFYLAVCSRLFRRALITSVHGGEVFPDGKRQARYSRAFRFLLASSDFIVAPSKRLRKDLLSVFPDLKRKAIFIHNGVNLAELDELRSEAKPPESSYILCISAYKEQKAIDVLIQAFKQVHQSESIVRLILVGAGHLRRDLEQLATALGNYDRIAFLDRQGRREVATLLRECKIFVLPSRFETFGIAILEAMAFKKPVVATTAGGIPEIIDSGKNGILVQPDNPSALAEALITLLNDADLRRELGENGYAMMRERFQSDHTGAAYENVFTSLVESAEKRAA